MTGWTEVLVYKITSAHPYMKATKQGPLFIRIIRQILLMVWALEKLFPTVSKHDPGCSLAMFSLKLKLYELEY